MSEIFKQLLLQFILILLNAFFAATEIAVISLNEKKVRAKADDGDKKAKTMLKMIEEPTGFLSTIQIGITLAGFLGSAFAADNFAERMSAWVINVFHVPGGYENAVNAIAVILVTLILSFFTLVLGELVPKRVAMQHKEKLAEFVCGFISTLSVVLKPIIWLLTVSTNAVLRLMGIDPDEKEDPVSEEDIVIMLDAGADEGSIDENDIEYIKNVFKLDKLTAADVMTHRNKVRLISEDASDKEILNIIENDSYSRIPVYRDTVDNIIGILYSRDYLLKHNRPNFKLKHAMFEPTFVPESMHLDLLFKDMQREHNHIVVVVNEYGVHSGIVTLEDILEELVGEIWDESDEEESTINQTSENTYRVKTNISMEDFLEYFALDADEESEATTVNGWLIEKNESIPKRGQTFEYGNIIITVMKANKIMTYEIEVKTKPAVEEETEEEK